MGVSAEYLDFICELMQPLGSIRSKRMFSGAGIYCDGLFFALVIDDILYLKADDENRPAFEREGLEPFTYEMRGKPTKMSYYRVPDEAMDSPALMLPWARGALAAALRARAAAPVKAVRRKRAD